MRSRKSRDTDADFQPDFLTGQSHEKFLLPNAVCSSELSSLVMNNTI